MDKATQTMIENLLNNTGKSLEQWIALVKEQKFDKHGEIIKFLKEQHQFTHGFANLVAHKARESDAGSVSDPNDLIDRQYAGKEHLKPFYDAVMLEILKFGSDIEIAPKLDYVSLRRKKQFALLKPASKTRFEIGVNLKGQEEKGLLLAEKPNAMCTHKMNIAQFDSVEAEVLHWLKRAYELAG